MWLIILAPFSLSAYCLQIYHHGQFHAQQWQILTKNKKTASLLAAESPSTF